VQSIVACGNCHTPNGPQGKEPGKELAGGFLIEDKAFTAYAPNITPDPQTGIGRWTAAQIATAIREGRRPDGTLIGPPMPIEFYRGLSDADVAAIVAYVRSVPPVRNQVPRTQYRIPLPPTYGPPVGKVADVPRGDKVAYGRYLAGPAGHCLECHTTPGPQGAPDLQNKLGAGGLVFNGPWGASVAANITPTGIGKYSDAELKKVVTTGVRPDGSRLKPPMGTAYYAHMTTADLDALVAYLRTLPPK
jgi:mono/diheme cytochrome c family protein